MLPDQPSKHLNLQACPVTSCKGLCKYSIGYRCLHFKFPFQPLLNAGQTLPYLLWVIFLCLGESQNPDCNRSHIVSAICHMLDFLWKCKALKKQKKSSSLWTAAVLTKRRQASRGWSAGNGSRKTLSLKRPGYRTAKLVSRPKGQLNHVKITEQNQRQGVIMAMQKL